MQVINTTIKKSKHFGEFLIVKIGDKQTKEAFFCEVYLIKREPARQQVDTSRVDLPIKRIPEYNVNVLLGRIGLASGSFIIGNVAMREEANKIVISIDERANHQYTWKQFDYSQRVAEPWEGGEICSLILTRDYEPNWTVLTYTGPPQVKGGEQ